jgi:methyl-accepting chemotaxis protein
MQEEASPEIKSAIVMINTVLRRITKGDLAQRIPIRELPSNMQFLGANINKMVVTIKENIEELRKREEELRSRQQENASAISAFSKVLDETAKGNLSARIDTKGWNEELEAIGMTINVLIESLEFEKKEKS